ncbi:hypothetical protein PM082_024965 [Marasmius tenuissimus]|nr:hypothetical protein PM082_024965 [Marasmius tenuissimus]
MKDAVVSICLGIPDSFIPHKHFYPTFDYEALLPLLVSFKNICVFCLNQIRFPVEQALGMLVCWPCIEQTSLVNVVNYVVITGLCFPENFDAGNPIPKRVVISGNMESMGGSCCLTCLANFLDQRPVHGLEMDGVSFEGLLLFLHTRHRRLPDIHDLVVLPLTSLYVIGSTGGPVFGKDKLSRQFPDLVTFGSYQDAARFLVEDSALVLYLVGDVQVMREVTLYDWYFLQVVTLAVSGKEGAVHLGDLSHSVRGLRYSNLTSLSIDNFRVCNWNLMFGSVFPVLQDLFVWTCQALSVEAFDLHRRAQLWSLPRITSFYFFAVGPELGGPCSEDRFFDLLLQWGIDSN